jgi:hypothetical protein
VIRGCVECIAVNRRDWQAEARLPLDAIRHAVGYVDEHLNALDPQADATIEISGKTVAVGAGFTEVAGILHYQGEAYPVQKRS